MKGLPHQMLDFYRSKPANERYNYGDTRHCAICQFVGFAGLARVPAAGGTYWRDAAAVPSIRHPLPKAVDAALATCPHTFGALADRLEASLRPNLPAGEVA